MKKIVIGSAWVVAFLSAQYLYALAGLTGLFEIMILWIVCIDWPWQLLVRLIGFDSGWLFIPAVPRHYMPLETLEDWLQYWGVTTIRSTIWLLTFPVKAALAIFLWRTLKKVIGG